MRAGVGAQGQRVKQAVSVGGILVVLFDDLFGKAAFLGDFDDQFLVVKGIAEFLRKQMADGAAAAARIRG